MKYFILLSIVSFTLFAEDALHTSSIAEKIKVDLVKSISESITPQAQNLIKLESEKIVIQSQQSSGLEIVYRPELRSETRYDLLLDLTKGQKNRLDVFYKALEENLLDAYYSTRLLKEIPANKNNEARILQLLQLPQYKNEKAKSFVAEVYKKLAQVNSKYIADFFESGIKAKYYFSDEDSALLMKTLKKGELNLSKESQWLLLTLIFDRYSSSHCKFGHAFFQEYYKFTVEVKDPYKEHEKIFNAFYPLWLKEK